MDKEFSLFDLGAVDEVAKESKAADEKADEKKATTKASNATSKKGTPKTPAKPSEAELKKKELEELKVTGEWIVVMANTPYQFSVENFFNSIPEEGITLEQVREEIEKQFFSFTKQRTRWDYLDKDKKQLLIESLGTAKGV